MTVKENWKTQKVRETIKGTSVISVFTCTHEEWSNGTFDIYIGDMFQNQNSMRATEIDMSPIDNTNCEITVYYSSEGVLQETRPNQKGSWKESFDVQVEPVNDNIFYNYKNNSLHGCGWYVWDSAGAAGDSAWGGVWQYYASAAFGSGMFQSSAVKNIAAPEITRYVPQVTYNVTCYASTLYAFETILNVGKVNSKPFIEPYFNSAKGQATGITDDISGWDDTGKWLFYACPIERTGYGNWKLETQFVYNKRGWNNVVAFQSSIGLYDTYDFWDLFSNVSSADSVARDPTGR